MGYIYSKSKVEGLALKRVTLNELAGMSPVDYAGVHFTLSDASLERLYDVYSDGVEWVFPYTDGRIDKTFSMGDAATLSKAGIVPPPPVDGLGSKVLFDDGHWGHIPHFQGLQGAPGVGLQVQWYGTQLGVKRDDESQFRLSQPLQGEQGTQGPQGIGLQFQWSGTQLGIRQANPSVAFQYQQLKGERGDTGA